MNLKVSIIVPVYNLAKYVGKAIESCLMQSYGNIEVIIVNDGSTDDSEKVIRQYVNDERIVYYKQKNAGVSAARNIGVQLATGDYITFLDADDMLQQDTVEKNVELIESQKERPDWVAVSVKRVDASGNEIILENKSMLGSFKYREIEVKSPADIFEMIEKNIFPAVVCASFFRKLFFDKPFINGRFEDSYMVMELLGKSPKIMISPYGAYLYVDREGSFINAAWTVSKWMDYTRVRIKILGTGISLFPSRKDFYMMEYCRMYYNLKYLKFKNRQDPEYREPLHLLLDRVPVARKFNMKLWLKYIIKCGVSFLRSKR